MGLSLKAIAKLGCATAVLGVAILLFAHTPMQSKVIAQVWGLNQLHYFQFKDKLKARAVPAVDKRFTFSTTESFFPAPTASHPSGFYEHPITVALSSEDRGGTIYYSLDGSIPTTDSRRYEKPLGIKTTTVLRFRSLGSGSLPSETVNRTFFVDEHVHLPVLSLIAHPVTLWNRYSGIYHNAIKRGRRWERPAYVEYFRDTHSPPRRFSATVRIHGGMTRYFKKKSFRLTYRGAGPESRQSGSIVHPSRTKSERTIILRQGGNDVRTRLHDELFQTLYAELGGLTSSFTPCVLFINGKIWGIYNIRERIDVEFLRKRLGRGQYDLIQGYAGVKSGGIENWDRTREFFTSHDLSSDAEFAKASELIDLDNLTDYWLMNIYAANRDWPGKNSYSFRRRDGDDPRWRWVSWDADLSFDFTHTQNLRHNTLAWATRDKVWRDLQLQDNVDKLKSTLIVRTLLKNDRYRRRFVRRFGDLLNVNLVPARVEALLDGILEMSKHDLAADWKRWSIPENEYWDEVEALRNFLRKRPEVIREYFQEEFGLGPSVSIGLYNRPPEGGKIQINTVVPDEYPWNGNYFQDERIVLRAKASPGFHFARWTDPRLGSSPEVSIDLKEDVRLGAEYRRINR
jgi:hypothetical protein